jgi:phosphoribosyl 1,2-cyclic phosphodiesterase
MGLYPERSGAAVIVKFCVLASSSSGNSIFIGTGRTRVLVDAGLSRKETAARLASIGEDIDALNAIVVTHEHSDHVSGLGVIARKRGTPVYCTELTATVLDWEDIRAPRECFAAGGGFVIGELEFSSFTIPHDAIDPVGFTVKADGVRMSIVTDLGYVPDSIKMHLRGTDVLLLESNHNLEMLKVGPYPWSVKQRIMGRKGHLSNDAAHEFIAADMDSTVSTLVLGHLSENTNYPTLVEQMAAEALRGRDVKMMVAAPGVMGTPILF